MVARPADSGVVPAPPECLAVVVVRGRRPGRAQPAVVGDEEDGDGSQSASWSLTPWKVERQSLNGQTNQYWQTVSPPSRTTRP
jgi:hypothetical protein